MPPDGEVTKVSRRAAQGGGTEREASLFTTPYQVRYQPGTASQGIVQGNGADWFGPLNPMSPVAPPQVEGRLFDYPSGYNLNIRPRAYEPVTFETMRALADGYDLMRIIIETRKDQMAALLWNVKPRDPKVKIAGAVKDRIKRVEDFFRRPDKVNFWDTWIRMVLEDVLVIDAPALHMRRTRGGQLYSLEQLDGATIKRVIDDWGRTPEPPVAAYQQVLKGYPAVDYTTKDILYRPRNPRVHKVYGYSPVEQVIMTVNIALRRQVFQLNYFTEGTVPEALIGVPDNWTPDQIRQFQDWFDSILTGNLAERRRARFVPSAMAKTYVETKQGELFGAAEEWFAKVICFAFSISAQPFLKMINRASAETAQEVALEEGLAPLQKWVKALIDTIIMDEFGFDDVEFEWNDAEELDPKAQADILKEYVSTGIRPMNEARAELGLDPYDDPAFNKPMVITANGYVFVSPTDQAGVNGQPNSPDSVAARLKPPQGPMGQQQQEGPPKGSVVTKPPARSKPQPAVKKYSEDQARDDHGRWTSGGDSEVANKSDIMEGVHPLAAAALGRQGVEDVKNAIARGAPQEEVLTTLQPMYDVASKWDATPTMQLTADGKPPEGFFDSRNYGTADNPRTIGQVMDHLTQQAKDYAGPGGPGHDKQAYILLGPSAAGKSTQAEKMALSTKSAIVDPDDAKKEIPEYRGGLGASAVHEESSAMGKALEARLTSSGTNIIVPTVGAHAPGIQARIDRLQSQGYHVNLVDVQVGKDEAARRMAGRALSTGRIINADAVRHIGDRPSETYDALKSRANGYARIDASGPRGTEHVTESLNFTGFTSRKSAFGSGGGKDREVRGSGAERGIPGTVRSQEEVLKAGRLTAPSFDRPRVQRSVVALSKAIKAHLAAAGVDIAAQVEKKLKKLGKADTPKQIDIAKLIAALDLSVFEQMAEDFEDDLTDVAEDAARLSLASVGGDKASELTDQVNEGSAKWAKSHSSQLVGTSNNPKFSLTDSTREMIKATIADGLASGKGSSEIADELQASYAFSADRAALIANTEIRRANSAGALVGYKEAKEAGVNVQKEWLLGNEPCDECETNADEGPIDLDEVFPSGDDQPPAHPNCNCSISPVVIDDQGEEENGDE